MTSLILSLVHPSGQVLDTIEPCQFSEGNQDLSSGPVDIGLSTLLSGMNLPPMLAPFLKMFSNLSVRLEISHVAVPEVIEGYATDAQDSV